MEAHQESLQILLFLTSVMMLIDNLYSLKYFHYTYMLELKRRFAAVGKGLPPELRLILRGQIQRENGRVRNFIQSAYIPWFVICIFTNLWYLPLAVTILTGFINMIYRKPYISPIMLMINLLIMSCSYLYGILSLFLVK